MSELPQGWRRSSVSDLALKMKAGGTPSRSGSGYYGGEIPFVKIEDMTASNGFLDSTAETITEAGLASSSTWIVPTGAVLLAMYASIGECAVNTLPVATNQAIIAIMPDPAKAMSEYLLYAFRHGKQHLASLNVQTTQKNINKGIVERFTVPLPPLSEQKAIAVALRAVQEARDARRRELADERERKAALMEDLFTNGVNGEPLKETEIGPLPESWNVRPLRELATFKNGINFSSSQKGRGTLTVDVLNMYGPDALVKLAKLYRVDAKLSEDHLLERDDILFVRSSLKQEGVGWASLFPGYDEAVTYCGFLIRARLSTELLPMFAVNYLRLPETRRLLVSLSGKVAITNISQSSIGGLPIPVPPKDEQNAIAAVMICCDEKIATLEKEVVIQDELFRAMLDELLSGRLSSVPLIERDAVEVA